MFIRLLFMSFLLVFIVSDIVFVDDIFDVLVTIYYCSELVTCYRNYL